MKIANIDREILHNFWTTWGISMKFSEKMCLMIILKVTKNQSFALCLEDTIFKKPQAGVKVPRNFWGRTLNIAVIKYFWNDTFSLNCSFLPLFQEIKKGKHRKPWHLYIIQKLLLALFQTRESHIFLV